MNKDNNYAAKKMAAKAQQAKKKSQAEKTATNTRTAGKALKPKKTAANVHTAKKASKAEKTPTLKKTATSKNAQAPQKSLTIAGKKKKRRKKSAGRSKATPKSIKAGFIKLALSALILGALALVSHYGPKWYPHIFSAEPEAAGDSSGTESDATGGSSSTKSENTTDRSGKTKAPDLTNSNRSSMPPSSNSSTNDRSSDAELRHQTEAAELAGLDRRQKRLPQEKETSYGRLLNSLEQKYQQTPQEITRLTIRTQGALKGQGRKMTLIKILQGADAIPRRPKKMDYAQVMTSLVMMGVFSEK